MHEKPLTYPGKGEYIRVDTCKLFFIGYTKSSFKHVAAIR